MFEKFGFTVPTAVQVILVTMFFSFAIRLIGKGLKLAGDYVAAKIPAEKLAMLKSKALTIVKVLEQAPQFQSYENSDKKEYAVLYVINQAEQMGFQVLEDGVAAAANALGLQITHADIDHIIEEAVADMKSEIVPLLVPAEPSAA
jgi:hypothetical protein